MLTITVPDSELYNEETEEFITVKGCTLDLEHSLISLSKWESKWEKAFLTATKKSDEENLDYIRCMTITRNVDPQVYSFIPSEQIEEVNRYISASMTATTIHDRTPGNQRQETITAEIIYYWMIAMNIPFECQKWHINRLLTLIRVCNIKMAPKSKSKMSPKAVMAQNRALNAERRRLLNTEG